MYPNKATSSNYCSDDEFMDFEVSKKSAPVRAKANNPPIFPNFPNPETPESPLKLVKNRSRGGRKVSLFHSSLSSDNANEDTQLIDLVSSPIHLSSVDEAIVPGAASIVEHTKDDRELIDLVSPARASPPAYNSIAQFMEAKRPRPAPEVQASK